GPKVQHSTCFKDNISGGCVCFDEALVFKAPAGWRGKSGVSERITRKVKIRSDPLPFRYGRAEGI
ncbi:MAG: hypothetical protein KKF12_11655, partial [Proteobacteria bacterium]|nr:hypothetical protein [Pseudomonadota bacterium]